ncbi:MAG: cation transporter [Solirubrobacterales bacterium]|nr:MAG: cation transporter [Solirubrobacterales bacterium]
MGGEVTAGIVASSLALLSDAAHLLTDAAALALALVAARLATRPAKGAMTFGLGRAEILSAQVNGLTLGLLAILVAIAAVMRLVHPPNVDAKLVLVVAAVGVVVNLLATRTLASSDRQSINIEGAYKHILTDLVGFAAAGVAALVILASGFQRADPIASLVVCAVMVHSAYGLLRSAGRVFMEAAPEGVDPGAIGRVLAEVPGVVEVHDLHVWEVTTGFSALAAHVLVDSGADCHAIRRELHRTLDEQFGLRHTTLQVDHRPRGGLLEIESG